MCTGSLSNMKAAPQKKVIVIARSGIGQPLGSVSREAIHELVENTRKGVTETLCLALLVSGDKEESASPPKIFAEQFRSFLIVARLAATYLLTVVGERAHSLSRRMTRIFQNPKRHEIRPNWYRLELSGN